MLSPFTGGRWGGFRDLDRLFGRLMDFQANGAGDGETDWSPAIDIVETADSYEVRVELAGVEADAVDVSVDGDVLTIRGDKQLEQAQDSETWTLRERAHGSFRRSFNLPAAVEADKIVAETNNGVLTVRIPKAEEAKPQQIEVKSN